VTPRLKLPTIGTWTQGNGTPGIPGYFLTNPCNSTLAWKKQITINLASQDRKAYKNIY